MELIVCPECGYPHGGPSCPNPACFANPHVSEQQKDAWRERNTRLKAEEAERQRIVGIRRRMRVNH